MTISHKLRTCTHSLMTDKRGGFIAGVIKLLLSALSFIYYCGVEFIKFLYRIGVLKSYRPACKVVSVGNITLGGTGKTPLVLLIAKYLKDTGKKVVVLSRGYGACNGISDEVEFLKKNLCGIPVLAGRDRTKTARQAVESFGAQIILLDDGFQHWRLKRDMDIVTLDAGNPFGNHKLLPRGILREPLSSLKRADMFVLTKTGPCEGSFAKAEYPRARLGAVNPNAAIFTSRYIPSRLFEITEKEELKLSDVENKKVALLCAIGDPESFKETVESLKANIAAKFFFMDHYEYTEKDIKSVLNECNNKGIRVVITTEKDISRLTYRLSPIAYHSVKFLALGIEMKIDREDKFFDRLHSVFNNQG